MANGKIRFGKQSGGGLALVFPDGVENTEVTFPESGELVNKDYADLKVALADFTGTNQSLSGSGYQKLPGGLIIQWGVGYTDGSGYFLTNLPVVFPNNYFIGVGTAGVDGSFVTPVTYLTNTQIGLKGYSSTNALVQSGLRITWIAVGK